MSREIGHFHLAPERQHRCACSSKNPALRSVTLTDASAGVRHGGAANAIADLPLTLTSVDCAI
jgi:hypothetical protein